MAKRIRARRTKRRHEKKEVQKKQFLSRVANKWKAFKYNISYRQAPTYEMNTTGRNPHSYYPGISIEERFLRTRPVVEPLRFEDVVPAEFEDIGWNPQDYVAVIPEQQELDIEDLQRTVERISRGVQNEFIGLPLTVATREMIVEKVRQSLIWSLPDLYRDSIHVFQHAVIPGEIGLAIEIRQPISNQRIHFRERFLESTRHLYEDINLPQF